MNALVKFEPLPLPDLRKPTAMPSLPAWAATQRAALAVNLQLVMQDGQSRFADVMTLPPTLLPSDQQRAEISRHCSNLLETLNETPERDDRFAAETLTAVTKMLSVLGGAKASELAAEAKAEAYMDALEDIPAWAVVAVSKRWYRGDCGNDEHGRPYDYRWMPDPATMRRLSLSDTFRIRNRVREFTELLDARPYVDCSADLERGRLAMSGLHKTMKDGGDVAALTFESAIKIGARSDEALA